MKFFHLGDLHLGKSVHHVPMAERDQPYWIEGLLAAAEELRPDAVLIAGDVYDRKVPSPEAVALLDRLLTGLAALGIPVLLVAGNHDSGPRLSFASRLLEEQGIYISGVLQKALPTVTLEDEYGPVTFWLMPYLYPRAVAELGVMEPDAHASYDAAVRALLSAQAIDASRRNVLVAHQNVLAGGVSPEHSDSETIIGGLGEIDVSAFDAFDYVALGHIHNAQAMGREGVRYAGCPLYYDFSEVRREKYLTVVELGEKGSLHIVKRTIPLLHTMERRSGTLAELLEAGQNIPNREEIFFELTLTDRHLPARAAEQLREVYGETLLHVRREAPPPEGQAAAAPGQKEALRTEKLFARFFLEQTGEYPDGAQEELLRTVTEQQSRHGEDYCPNAASVPQAETEELLELLLKEKEAEQ